MPNWIRTDLFHGRRASGAAFAACLAGWLALNSAGSASARLPGASNAQFEDLSVLVNGYEVFASLAVGEVATPPLIRASLTDGNGQLRSATAVKAGADGSAALAFLSSGLAAPHRPVLMQPGQRLRLEAVDPRTAASLVSITLQIPNLTADLDPATGRLGGLAPAGTVLGITARRADGTPTSQQKATAGADGGWQLDMGAVMTLEPGARGNVYYRDGEVVWQRAWAVPGLRARIGGATVTAFTVPGDVLIATTAAGSRLATADAVAWDGTAELVLRDATGQLFPLPTGAALTVARASGSPMTLSSAATQVGLDPASDRVTGSTLAGTRLVVELAEPSQNRTSRREVVAGANGAFELQLAGEYDISADTRLVLSWPAAAGLSLTAFAPRATSRDALVAVLAGQGTAGEPVGARMTNPGGTVLAEAAGQVAADGRFRLLLRAPGKPATSPVAWTGDASVEVFQDGRQMMSFESVAPLGIEASASADTVGSIGDAGEDGTQVTVTVGDESRKTIVSGGAWQIETGDWADLQPGTPVSLNIVDTNGIETAFDFPVLRASVQPGTDRVRVEGPPGLTADIEHSTDGRTASTSRCTVVRTTCTVSLADKQGQPVVLKAGDSISVFPSAGDTADIDVQKVNAHIDPGGNDVVGEGPPHEPVRVEFSNPEGLGIPQGGSLGTDAQGVYDFELRSSENGLMLPGLAADVFQLRPNRHQVWARGVLEQLRLTAGSAELRGLVEPMTRVVAWLNDGVEADPRMAMASGETMSDRDGRFEVRLVDGAGRPVPAAAGRTVGISHARGERLVTVPLLFAWHRVEGKGGSTVDQAGSTVVGQTSAGSTLVGQTSAGFAVKALYTTAPGALGSGAPEEPGLVVVRTTADAGGFFELQPPVLSPEDILRIEVVATLPSGDEIRMVVPSDAQGSTVFLPSAAR